MHPKHHAQTHPDKAAYIMAGSGETVTYKQLDERSNQGAHLFRSLGIGPGDAIATWGAAMLVPESRPSPPPGRVEVMPTPGATRSGLVSCQVEIPRALRFHTAPSAVTAPTPRVEVKVAGARRESGLLPMAATTKIPASTMRFTACW